MKGVPRLSAKQYALYIRSVKKNLPFESVLGELTIHYNTLLSLYPITARSIAGTRIDIKIKENKKSKFLLKNFLKEIKPNPS